MAQPAPALATSYAFCRELTRTTAHNFGYAFWTLPAKPRQAMSVLYAFMRVTDDLGDRADRPVEQRRRDLEDWRQQLHAALCGQAVQHPVLPAMADVAANYGIDAEHLTAVITGVEQDLIPRVIQTEEELADYCYLVAGAVGLCCLPIWGCRDAAARASAIACGRAFQRTNILRDISEDAAVTRFYVPQEALDRFGCSWTSIPNSKPVGGWRDLLVDQTHRAQADYVLAEELFQFLPRGSRPILRTMLDIYGGLLQLIIRRDYDVFSSRVRLSRPRKIYLTLKNLLSFR